MLRCLVCSMWQTFLSSSLTVSMSALFRIRILSCMFMRGVLHVHLEFCHKVYAVNEKPLEKLLAYVSPVDEYLSKEPVCEVLVLQWFTVVHVSRRERPLYYLVTVVYYYMQLEPVEPSHHTAHPFIVLWLCARFILHDFNGVEFIMDIPVHLPNAHVMRLMSERKLLDKISATLHINKNTAFDWWHKILRSLKQDDGSSFSRINNRKRLYVL